MLKDGIHHNDGNCCQLERSCRLGRDPAYTAPRTMCYRRFATTEASEDNKISEAPSRRFCHTGQLLTLQLIDVPQHLGHSGILARGNGLADFDVFIEGAS